MSETNLEQFREVAPAGRFTLQNSSLLKVRLEGDTVQAKLGSMVAYQGGVRFEQKSGGLGRFFKKAVTGEGVQLMTCTGTGDLFLAQDARKIMVIDLEGERMTVNGDSILAFEGDVDWDIRRVEGAGRLAGGLFNVVLEGTGKVAVTSHGDPVLLDTSSPTFADPDSAIAWSGGVRTSVRSDVSFKTFLGRGSGETFQIAFEGPGWVLIQPSEGPTVPEHSHGAGGGGGMGSLRRRLALPFEADMLEDWIFDENLKPFVETLARSIGYGFDDWDWDAIRYGVQETDYEIDRWYGYEFAGRRLMRFSLAQSSYSSRIFVRVDAEGRQRSVEVAEENLRPFVETLAGSAGYSFDDWDWDAIKYGVEETNYEADRWYGYEFAGKKLVKFCTAKDPGSSVVFVRINADEDLEGRAEVAIQIMKIYRLSTEP